MNDPSHPPRAAGPAPAVRVQALGRFAVEVRGKPLASAPRTARRPLELLQALIASGGVDVPETRLSETLWPDADGDRAHRAFATTLHRLRRLLGHESLSLRQGRLTLEPRYCWVDALAFLYASEALADDDATTGTALLESALAHYQGAFLEGGPELGAVLAMRERLRALFVQRALRLGRLLEGADRRAEAVAMYERALALEPAAEALCRALMHGCLGTGRAGEAIEAYRRHRRIASALGAPPPGAEIEALLRDALALQEAQVPLPEEPSLAVLPFELLGPAPTARWLADAMTENLAARLVRLPRLLVIDLHSTRAYRDRPPRIRQIGAELGVRYVLRGTVQLAGGQLRLTTSLVDAPEETAIWAEHYDMAPDGALDVQDRIVENILTALQVQLTEGEQARTLWRGTTDNPQAWELAVHALEHFRRFTAEEHAEARRLWKQALALDPHYVMALVPLGWIHVSDARSGRTARPRRALEKAEALAHRALHSDPRSGPAHVLLAHLRIHQQRHDEGRMLLLRAAELNPGGADTAVIVGVGLTFCGEATEGLRWVRRAMRLSPFYPEWYLAHLGAALYFNGDPAGALQALQRSQAVRNRDRSLVIAAASQMALDRAEEACETVRRLLHAFPNFTLRRRLHWLFPLRQTEALERFRTRLRAAGCP
jgi:adenylate cyclase